MALRIGIESPPTWVSGIGHSQRSAWSRPSATAEPSALARKLAWVSATGLGSEVVPEVCMTASVGARSAIVLSGDASGSGAAQSGSVTIELRARASRLARSASPWRRSTGTTGSPGQDAGVQQR